MSENENNGESWNGLGHYLAVVWKYKWLVLAFGALTGLVFPSIHNTAQHAQLPGATLPVQTSLLENSPLPFHWQPKSESLQLFNQNLCCKDFG